LGDHVRGCPLVLIGFQNQYSWVLDHFSFDISDLPPQLPAIESNVETIATDSLQITTTFHKNKHWDESSVKQATSILSFSAKHMANPSGKQRSCR
jgi:hypothetical protein